MKLKSLIAASVLAVCCITGTVLVSAAEESKSFSDVNYSDDTGAAIKKMTDAGYLKGYPDGTFKPNATITRAELTTVFNNVFGYTEINNADMKDFADNSDPKAWYYTAVRIAQSNGYINGFEDNTFRPQDNFTREQTAVVIALAGKLENKEIKPEILDAVSPWAVQYVDAVINNNIIPLETGMFRAKENITRGEVCRALVNFVPDKDSTTETTTKASVETTKANTTENTTEKTTETTTKKTTPSGGGGSGSGGGGSSSSGGNNSSSTPTDTEATTETITETTTEAPATDPSEIILNDEQLAALERTIRTTKNVVIIDLSNENLKDIARFVLNSMESYYADQSYDIVTDGHEVRRMYDNLSSDEKQEFQEICYSSYNISDISLLMDVFGPLLGL